MTTTTIQTLDPEAAKVLQTKLQTPSIDAASKVTEEAEGNKGVLFHKLIEAATAFAKAEDSMSKVLGANFVLAITHLIRLPEKIRPKYTEIQDTVVTAMGRTLPGRTFVKNPEETFSSRFSKKPVYRQKVTPWIDMARWEIGQYTKQEQAHQTREAGWKQEVKYFDQVYTSPVSMLQAGVAWTTVHTSFRNNLRPAFLDLSVLPEKVAERHGKDYALKGKKGAIMIPMRITKDQQVVKTRTPALGNAALTHGIVMGLLGSLSGPVTQRRYDELQAALLLVKPEPKPAA